MRSPDERPFRAVRRSAAKSVSRGFAGMFSHRWTSSSPIVERTAARSPSRNSRRTTTPSVSVRGGRRAMVSDTRWCQTPLAELFAPRAFTLTAGATTATAAGTVAPWAAVLAGLARRGVLRPLDELLGADQVLALVLLHELEPDPSACLVDLLDDHVENVAAGDHVFDVVDAPGADVRDVEQAVGALLQLDERTEVGGLDDPSCVGVSDLRLLGEVADRLDGGVALGALG